ncbi:MAG TPA: N-acetylmuramic acid 6-phosphate etherase [Syntrophorhabdaceae bacterium]|nr:N-acetylmuramic acid 6-phosphate etherase [Syntrophorhabdaceae bacterium]
MTDKGLRNKHGMRQGKNVTFTEEQNPRSEKIDLSSIQEIVDVMSEEDMLAARAVTKARPSICSAIEEAIRVIRSGGRLVYLGAGTSGRLGVLDASEIPPTFSVPARTVQGIIAGGRRALTRAAEGAEDDEDAGIRAVSGLTTNDMLLGISASGKTPFVIAALKAAKLSHARCWLLTCNDVAYPFLNGTIFVPVGPEIIAGSTRLKAGTATKMVLNMISTVTMIKLGRVYDGYMIDVAATNKKLKERSLTIVRKITGSGEKEAETLLMNAGGRVKVALLMKLKGITRKEAVGRLKKAGGSFREALRF